MKIELIHWLDSRSDDSWTKNLDMEVCVVRTVGYVVKETENVIAVVSSIDNYSKQYTGILYIPKVCVTSREALILVNDS